VQYILAHNTANDPQAQFSMTNTRYVDAIQRRTGQRLSPVMKSTAWSLYALTPSPIAPASLAAN